jgi:hypothetical protein
VSPLVAKLVLELKDLEPVQNLVTEADMAVQILEHEDNTPIVEAVKEGLASALEGLREE